MRRVCSVNLKASYSAPVEKIWAVANHPAKLAPKVGMLRGFSAPQVLQRGTKVEETHAILFWPQHYKGRITAYKFQREWAMNSSPCSWGPFPLPHYVRYRFRAEKECSNLEIFCCFRCEGFLSLPLVPILVEWYMRRTISKLLQVVGVQSGATYEFH